MRAAAILGLGTSPRDLRVFQERSAAEWTLGLPAGPDQADAILVFGGDGTVHRNLNALVRLDLPVLVVPAGSGNDFARALGLLKLRDSLAAWRAFEAGKGRVRSVELGCITPLACSSHSYFACVAGVGLDADIARRANTMPRWLRRTGGYALSLPSSLFSLRPFQARIFTPTGAPTTASDPSSTRLSTAAHNDLPSRVDEPAALVAFANAPFYGGGMKIAPDARLDDGALDVCLIRDMDKFKLFCLFPTVYFGGHLSVKEVKYFQTEQARVETDPPRDIYADGEPVGKTPAQFSVARSVLRVIVKLAAQDPEPGA